jgi:hypothetical protein
MPCGLSLASRTACCGADRREPTEESKAREDETEESPPLAGAGAIVGGLASERWIRGETTPNGP